MDDLKATLGRHTNLSGMEMLAIASQFVGNLIAFQDQNKVTPAMALEVVSINIEEGNRMALSPLAMPEGRA